MIRPMQGIGVVMAGAFLLTAQAHAATGYGFIGDSITRGYGLLPAPSGNSLITESFARTIAGSGPSPLVITRAYDGFSTRDWLPHTSVFRDAYDRFNQAGIDTVIITLGDNDSRGPNRFTPEQYAANLRSITASLLREGSTVKKISLNCPTYVLPGSSTWTDDSNTLMLSYAVTHESIADGARIILGDRLSYAYMRDTPTSRPDGIHPNEEGARVMGIYWAAPFVVPESGSLWLAVIGFAPLLGWSYRHGIACGSVTNRPRRRDRGENAVVVAGA